MKTEDPTLITITTPRGLLHRLLLSIEYELDTRFDEAQSKGFDGDAAEGWHYSILKELLADRAELRHLLGKDAGRTITIASPDGEFDVDSRGFPVVARPENGLPVVRVDLAERRVHHGLHYSHEEPARIDLSDLAYRHRRDRGDVYEPPRARSPTHPHTQSTPQSVSP